jgi:hypothetical protein
MKPNDSTRHPHADPASPIEDIEQKVGDNSIATNESININWTSPTRVQHPTEVSLSSPTNTPTEVNEIITTLVKRSLHTLHALASDETEQKEYQDMLNDLTGLEELRSDDIDGTIIKKPRAS